MVAAVIAGIGAANQLYAQQPDLEAALDYLLDNALEIKIGLQMTQPHRQAAWNTQQSELTIPGRSVDVEITGTNLHVRAVFTPYLDAEGTITLVAQGQVWLAEAPEAGVRYVSTYRSVPMGLGEKILFFPLGVAEEVADEFTLRLEVEIAPYATDRYATPGDASPRAADG